MSNNDTPCKTCNGFGYLVVVPGTASEGGRTSCPSCGGFGRIAATPEITALRAQAEAMAGALEKIVNYEMIPPMDYLTTAERLEASSDELKQTALIALTQWNAYKEGNGHG